MRNSLRILLVAVLSFIGGMQIDRGFIVQIYFDDSRSDEPVVVRSENKPRGGTSKPVEKIVLLGERHGGTNWITDHLTDCFGDRIEVRRRLLNAIVSCHA